MMGLDTAEAAADMRNAEPGACTITRRDAASPKRADIPHSMVSISVIVVTIEAIPCSMK